MQYVRLRRFMSSKYIHIHKYTLVKMCYDVQHEIQKFSYLTIWDLDHIYYNCYNRRIPRVLDDIIIIQLIFNFILITFKNNHHIPCVLNDRVGLLWNITCNSQPNKVTSNLTGQKFGFSGQIIKACESLGNNHVLLQ